jgi:hypothetical protein
MKVTTKAVQRVADAMFVMLCGALIGFYLGDAWVGRYDTLLWIALCLLFAATAEHWWCKYIAEIRWTAETKERIDRLLRGMR